MGETPTRCGRCGTDPAHGYATSGGVRYCHPDDPGLPDCYTLANYERASSWYRERARRLMTHDEAVVELRRVLRLVRGFYRGWLLVKADMDASLILNKMAPGRFYSPGQLAKAAGVPRWGGALDRALRVLESTGHVGVLNEPWPLRKQYRLVQ